MITAIERVIADAVARAIFVSAWADWIDQWHAAELGPDERPPEVPAHPGPGGDYMDYAPQTPRDALNEAWRFIGKIEANHPDFAEGPKQLHWIFMTVVKRDSTIANMGFRELLKLAKDFGHYLAMESIGHGVSWSDDHEDHGLSIDYLLEGVYELDEDIYPPPPREDK